MARIPPTGSSRRQCQPRRQRLTDLDAAWPNTVAIVPRRMKQWVLRAMQAGQDDEDIAESTGLDPEQVTAIRSHLATRFAGIA